MPVELQIIRTREFVRLDAHGEFDFESTCKALESFAEACDNRGVDRALLDARGATSNLTARDLATLVGAFAKAAVSKRLRSALLHTGNQKYRARLFAFLSAMRGRKVKAFDNFEEAVVWLSRLDEARTIAVAAEHEGITDCRSSLRL